MAPRREAEAMAADPEEKDTESVKEKKVPTTLRIHRDASHRGMDV